MCGSEPSLVVRTMVGAGVGLAEVRGREDEGTSPNSNFVSARMSPLECAYAEAEEKRERAAVEMRS